MSENWKIWDKFQNYGDVFYKRATGELPEMESSKAIADEVAKVYAPGMKLLDVGCGAGHYLVSLRNIVDKNISYHGVDLTENYIELARKAFKEPDIFSVGNVNSLQFDDNSFDIVLCANTLTDIPPPPKDAIKELVRVGKKYIIIRTLIGKSNYIIKQLMTNNELNIDIEEKELISEDGELKYFNYINMYTESYLRSIISDIPQVHKVYLKKDESWNNINDNNLNKGVSTKVVDGKQVAGNLIYNFYFITIQLSN